MKAFIKKFAGVVAVLALAVTMAFTPAGVVGAQSTGAGCDTGPTGGVAAGIDCSKNDNVPTTLFGNGSIFTTVVNILLFIIGAISVIMLIWGGIRYTTSGGSSSAVTSAKNTIMYAIIGLVVAFLAFAIVNWVLGEVGKAA